MIKNMWICDSAGVPRKIERCFIVGSDGVPKQVSFDEAAQATAARFSGAGKRFFGAMLIAHALAGAAILITALAR